MTGAEAAALGFWLPVLGRAVIGALGENVEDASWNVIQANGITFPFFLHFGDGYNEEDITSEKGLEGLKRGHHWNEEEKANEL